MQAESKVIQRKRLCTKCIFRLITRLIRIYFKQWHLTIEAINTIIREKRNSVEQQKRIIVRMLKGALMKAWSRWQDAQRCLRLSLRYARRIYENVNARRLSRLKRGYFEWMRVALAQLRKDNLNSRLVPEFRAQMMVTKKCWTLFFFFFRVLLSENSCANWLPLMCTRSL